MTIIEEPKAEPSICRYCQARIVWALTEAQRRQPVNVEPHPKGNLLLFVELDFVGNPIDPNVHHVRRATPDDEPGPRWICHFATCPHCRPRQP